jgi:hypothetical protein
MSQGPGTSSSSENDITSQLQAIIPSKNWIRVGTSTPNAVERIRDLKLDVLIFGDVFMDSITAHIGIFRIYTHWQNNKYSFWGIYSQAAFRAYIITSSRLSI